MKVSARRSLICWRVMRFCVSFEKSLRLRGSVSSSNRVLDTGRQPRREYGLMDAYRPLGQEHLYPLDQNLIREMPNWNVLFLTKSRLQVWRVLHEILSFRKSEKFHDFSDSAVSIIVIFFQYHNFPAIFFCGILKRLNLCLTSMQRQCHM